jgi:hypothetical protein
MVMFGTPCDLNSKASSERRGGAACSILQQPHLWVESTTMPELTLTGRAGGVGGWCREGLILNGEDADTGSRRISVRDNGSRGQVRQSSRLGGTTMGGPSLFSLLTSRAVTAPLLASVAPTSRDTANPTDDKPFIGGGTLNIPTRGSILPLPSSPQEISCKKNPCWTLTLQDGKWSRSAGLTYIICCFIHTPHPPLLAIAAGAPPTSTASTPLKPPSDLCRPCSFPWPALMQDPPQPPVARPSPFSFSILWEDTASREEVVVVLCGNRRRRKRLILAGASRQQRTGAGGRGLEARAAQRVERGREDWYLS